MDSVAQLIPLSTCLPKGGKFQRQTSQRISNEEQKYINTQETNTASHSYCCGASVASEEQHNQDLRTYKREYEFSNSSLFTKIHCIAECTAPLLTRVHCATNNTRMSYRLFAWIPMRNFALIYLQNNVKEIGIDFHNCCFCFNTVRESF